MSNLYNEQWMENELEDISGSMTRKEMLNELYPNNGNSMPGSKNSHAPTIIDTEELAARLAEQRFWERAS
jgi:hypothetical protein